MNALNNGVNVESVDWKSITVSVGVIDSEWRNSVEGFVGRGWGSSLDDGSWSLYGISGDWPSGSDLLLLDPGGLWLLDGVSGGNWSYLLNLLDLDKGLLYLDLLDLLGLLNLDLLNLGLNLLDLLDLDSWLLSSDPDFSDLLVLFNLDNISLNSGGGGVGEWETVSIVDSISGLGNWENVLDSLNLNVLDSLNLNGWLLDSVSGGNWGGNLLNNWRYDTISSGFRSGVGKVASNSLGTDDSRIGRWDSVGNSVGAGNSQDSDENGDGLHFG